MRKRKILSVIYIAIHNNVAHGVLRRTYRAVRALPCRRKYAQPANCHGRGSRVSAGLRRLNPSSMTIAASLRHRNPTSQVAFAVS
jgi:hypothetical protein